MSLRYPTLGILIILAGCGGGIKTSGSGPSGGSSETRELNLQVQVMRQGEGAGLLDSPVVEIFAQRLNFTADCTDGGGTLTDSFMGLGTDSDDESFTANFTTTIPSYCDTASIAVTSLVGKFDSATTGMTFTLNAAAAATTYRAGAWSVHANLSWSVGPGWVALFEFDKFGTSDTVNDTITARETINGTISVEVNDRCAGSATIAAVGSSTTSFTVEVPHTLTTPVQWTEKVQDNTQAVSPYTENGAAVGGTHGKWTFEFKSATVTDAGVQYKLIVSGTGGMQCIATVSFAVTATDGTPTTIP